MMHFLEWVLQATVLFAFATGAAFVLRRKPAMAHLVWVAAFCGLILLKPVSLMVGDQIFLSLTPVSANHDEFGTGKATNTHQVRIADSKNALTNSRNTSEKQQSSIGLAGQVTIFWLLGVALFAGRTAIGLLRLTVMHNRRSRAIRQDDLPVDVQALAHRLGMKGTGEIRICTTPRPATAMTWGLYRPVILLPHGADEWPRERLEVVLLHELAHVRRFDFASQLLAELACALYWFLPLAWIGARSMRGSAEIAADDLVLRTGVKASSYATELLQMAADLGNRQRKVILLGVHFMSQPKIESRIRSILSPNARFKGLTSVHLLAVIAIACISVPIMAGLSIGASPTAGKSSQDLDRKAALETARSLMTATNIYWEDHDSILPYALNTSIAANAIHPYVLDQELLSSPTKGGVFEFNINIGGVDSTTVSNPSQVPVWVEKFDANTKNPVAVGYLDCHSALVYPQDFMALKEALAKKYVRPRGLRPLPKID